MSQNPHLEMMEKTNSKDVRTSVITAGVTAILTAVIGARFLEAIENVQSASAPKWILGRSTGLAAYLLLLCLAVMGLLLSHPNRAKWNRPSAITRIRIHVSLAIFTLVFLVSHVVVLASDPYAGVGIIGSLIPFTAHYRPLAVTLGILAVWSGLAAGVTASLAGNRLLVRAWWPIHKVAITAYLLAWFHSVLAGTDSKALEFFYIATGLLVLAVALWRYHTPGHSEKVSQVSHKARSLKHENSSSAK